MSSKQPCGNPSLERMNFLLQASEACLSLGAGKPAIVASAYYTKVAVEVARRSQSKIHPTWRRQFCPGCRLPLISGVTATMRLKSAKRGLRYRTQCHFCGTYIQRPARKKDIWADQPQTQNSAPQENEPVPRVSEPIKSDSNK